MKVVVVGGGLSGLFTASELEARGADVEVVEAGAEPGGLVQTLERDGFQLEPAAGTLNLPHPHLSPILARAGVDTVPAAASERFVFDGARLHHLSASARVLATGLLPLSSKLRALTEPLARPGISGDVSVEEFLVRRLGRRAGELLAWLAACGVFAGDPSRLSAKAAFPMLTALAGEKGSLLRGVLDRRRGGPTERPRPHLPVGGMSGLARRLAGDLGRIRFGFEVARLWPDGSRWRLAGTEEIGADRVVLAVSPDRAAHLLDAEIGAVLGVAVSAPVAVVFLGGRAEPRLSGFGALTTPGSGTVGLGYLFESSYAPSRAPDPGWLVKVIAGGARRPDVIGWDDDRLLSVVSGEVGAIFGAELDPDLSVVVRHRPGIPQYQIGHGRWLSDLDGMLADRPGLHLTGWGYRGVGVTQLASDAVRVAEAVLGPPR